MLLQQFYDPNQSKSFLISAPVQRCTIHATPLRPQSNTLHAAPVSQLHLMDETHLWQPFVRLLLWRRRRWRHTTSSSLLPCRPSIHPFYHLRSALQFRQCKMPHSTPLTPLHSLLSPVSAPVALKLFRVLGHGGGKEYLQFTSPVVAQSGNNHEELCGRRKPLFVSAPLKLRLRRRGRLPLEMGA